MYFLVLIGLVSSNFIYQYLNSADWNRAASMSFAQAVAVLACWLVARLDNREDRE